MASVAALEACPLTYFRKKLQAFAQMLKIDGIRDFRPLLHLHSHKDCAIGDLPVDYGVLGVEARLHLHNPPILAQVGLEVVQGQVNRPVDDPDIG